MTRSAVNRRYDDGAQIATRAAGGGTPAGHQTLLLIRTDGQLAAVTETSRQLPQAGDVIVSLGPASPAAGPS
jgi:hypothetical protein